MGAPGVAERRITTGLAGGRTSGCVITCGGVGPANSGDKTAVTPGDNFTWGIGVYLGSYIMPPIPWTQVS